MALCLSMDCDAWSLGGQMLLHIRWYLFPLEGAVICLLLLRLQARLNWSQEVLIKAGHVALILVLVVVGWRFFLHEPNGPLSLREYRDQNPSTKASFSPDEWEALLYIRKNAQPDAVIISDNPPTAYFYPISGIAGRAAFLESAGNPLDLRARQLDPGDNRVDIMKTLWSLQGYFARRICQVAIKSSSL
jgi:hypothetical protein